MKSNQHATAILSNAVTHSKAIIAYRVYHLTSIDYSLGVTYLTTTQCETIQGRAVITFLATRGYNRNFPEPSSSLPNLTVMWAWFPSIYSKANRAFVCSSGTLHNTGLGRQIDINMAWVQLEAGIGTLILDNTQENLDYVQDSWVMGIHRFLSKVKGAIRRTYDTPPTTYRRNDRFLMDVFREQGIPRGDLCHLNRCCQYFQVAQLSDITNIAGNQLYDHVLPLNRDTLAMPHPVYPTSTLQWPRQPKPGAKTCSLWTCTLRHTLLQDDDRLRQPIGPCTAPVDDRD
jgi:hypothetical protein